MRGTEKRLSKHEDDLSEHSTSSATWLDDIREALSLLDGWEIPERARKTVFRCLCAEMVEAAERYEEYVRTQNDGKKWTLAEVDQLSTLLKGRIAKTWSEEKNTITEASLQLQRSEKSVKRKAIEIGCARAVDYYGNTGDA